MSIKTAIAAALLLSTAAFPALAENYAADPASPAPRVEQAPIFGGKVANKSNVAQGAADARVHVATGRTLRDYLADPAYQGGA